MAQLVEQLIRNQQVAGSSPATSSKVPKALAFGTLLFYQTEEYCQVYSTGSVPYPAFGDQYMCIHEM